MCRKMSDIISKYKRKYDPRFYPLLHTVNSTDNVPHFYFTPSIVLITDTSILLYKVHTGR